MKQCVELEFTKALIGTLGMESEHKLIIKEDVLESAEALILASLSACSELTQPLEHVEVWGLLTIFSPQRL